MTHLTLDLYLEATVFELLNVCALAKVHVIDS